MIKILMKIPLVRKSDWSTINHNAQTENLQRIIRVVMFTFSIGDIAHNIHVSKGLATTNRLNLSAFIRETYMTI